MIDNKSLGKRILVLGSSGSGKTYFSKKLAQKLGYKNYHLDDIFWGRNWQPINEDLFLQKLSTILNYDSWIIDGNYLRYLPIRVSYADTVIFIGYTYCCMLVG